MMEPCYKASPRQTEDWHRNYTVRKSQYANIMSFGVELPADVNISALEQAYSLLLQKHEVLRTYFPQENKEIRQQVAAYDPNVFGLQHIESADPEALAGIKDKIMADLKNLKKPPLIQGVLWKKRNPPQFVCFIHHIISDQWSIRILKEDLTELYLRLIRGEARRPELSIIRLGRYFEDHSAVIECRHLQNLVYWRDRLADKAWHLDFQRIHANCSYDPETRSARPGNWDSIFQVHLLRQSRGQLYRTQMDAGLFRKLHRFRQDIGLSMYGVLIGSLSILGYKLSGNRNILIPTHFSNRHDPSSRDVIGNLLGTVFLYNPVRDDCTIEEYILECYSCYLESIDKMLYSSETLESLQLSIRCFLHFNFISLESTGAGHCGPEEDRVDEAYDVISPLFCQASEYNNTIALIWGYHLRFFDAGLIRQLAACYFRLLEEMCTSPRESIADLQLFPLNHQHC